MRKCFWCREEECTSSCPAMEEYPPNSFQQMIEDAIKSGVTLIRDMPYCSFCNVRGEWTDDGPVFEKHKDTCLITKYNNYLRDN